MPKWLSHPRAYYVLAAYARTWCGKKIWLTSERQSDRALRQFPSRKILCWLLDYELGISLHLELRNFHIKAKVSPIIRALYSATLLEQENSSLKDREMLWHQEHIIQLLPRLLKKWMSHQRQHAILWPPQNKFSCRTDFMQRTHTL